MRRATSVTKFAVTENFTSVFHRSCIFILNGQMESLNLKNNMLETYPLVIFKGKKHNNSLFLMFKHLFPQKLTMFFVLYTN